jgi:hypothetical protein
LPCGAGSRCAQRPGRNGEPSAGDAAILQSLMNGGDADGVEFMDG